MQRSLRLEHCQELWSAVIQEGVGEEGVKQRQEAVEGEEQIRGWQVAVVAIVAIVAVIAVIAVVVNIIL